MQARPFADALGIQIGWDAAQRQVTVIRAANEPVLRMPVKRVHMKRRAHQVALTTGTSVVTSEPEMAQLHARQALRTQLRDYIVWLKAENVI